jgi:hypothetical protein
MTTHIISIGWFARRVICVAAFALAMGAVGARAGITNFVNFETAPVHPGALGPDGHTLAVCNLPDGRVELFDVASGVPTPVGSVAVGLDPVTARFASANEFVASPSAPTLFNDMISLALRTNSRVEVILRGKKDGLPRNWLFRRATQDFQSDRHGEIAPTLAEVIAPATDANPFTATVVPEGSGVRLALDRDGDGYFDTSEVELGYDPADPSSHPGRIVSISKNGNEVALRWESAPGVLYAV